MKTPSRLVSPLSGDFQRRVGITTRSALITRKQLNPYEEAKAVRAMLDRGLTEDADRAVENITSCRHRHDVINADRVGMPTCVASCLPSAVLLLARSA